MNVALNTAMEHYFTRAGELFPEEMKETPLLKAALKMHLKRQRENCKCFEDSKEINRTIQ